MNTKVSDFEQVLRKNAIYSSDRNKMNKFAVNELLREHSLELLGKGFETRAYRVMDSDWVVKEGRWDLDFEPIMHLTVKIPREQAQKLLRAFKFTFLPEIDEVLIQYGHYLKLVEYFGYFPDEEIYFHPNIDSIHNKQVRLRQEMNRFIEKIDDKYSLPEQKELKKILSSNLNTYNFLPQEYLLYGRSISRQNKGKDTYYIFQRFVKGKTLFEHNVKKLSGKNRKLMILLSYLVLLLNTRESLVPDLRPRYILQTHDWFGDTDNIILADKGPVLIDTRRVWETNSNFVKRGLLVPELITLRTKHYLQHYLSNV